MVVHDAEARKQRILLKRKLAKQENNDQQETVATEEQNTSSEVSHSEEVDTQTDNNPTLDIIPDSRTLISNVYRYLNQEYKFMQLYNGDSNVLRPLAAIRHRTAGATGVSRRVVRNILKEDRVAVSKRRRENPSLRSNTDSTSSVTNDNPPIREEES